MNRELSIALRAMVGLIVLAILAWTVMGWWRDYKSAPQASPSDATSTASPSAGGEGGDKPAENSPADKGTAKADLVVVLIDGLNLRKKPASSADAIRGLDKGEKLTLLKTQQGWYQVKSSKGETGWISSNSSYSRVEKR